jgi:uncharacterized membrane protein
MALFTSEGFVFLLRWIHFLAGITWIGLLYYFNFVQGPFFAETDPPTKNNATAKLVPRALWWFRWGAMFTFLSGLGMALFFIHQGGYDYLASASWMLIFIGATLGIAMFLNVWFVIWPNQKIVIASTQAVLAGGQANPGAAAAARRAFLASRTNVLFSMPMLFYMGAARHLTIMRERPATGIIVVFGALILLIEMNALVGDKGPTKQPLEKIPGVITAGVVLTLVFYILTEIMM